MNWTMTKRRMATAIFLVVLAISPIVGLKFGWVAAADPARSEHYRSQYLPYVVNQPFLITIEHPGYMQNTQVLYAHVQDTNGNRSGYWAPFRTKGQVKHKNPKNNRWAITVLFDTSNFLTAPPVEGLHAPGKGYPGPTGSLGSGSILCITTGISANSDDCPMTPETVFLLDTVDVSP